ncbi:unnamed protein product [Euphydryas editha]|uniref:Uncharacterized protein n=1 Tax=Euphydryas editha TaxID=104508 RepID=A0AAU9V0M8_EUPED|nr:unnamed protein product [Euphydryas editha]
MTSTSSTIMHSGCCCGCPDTAVPQTCLRMPRCCSTSGMLADARIDCFQLRKRCASLVRRARSRRNIVLKMIAT